MRPALQTLVDEPDKAASPVRVVRRAAVLLRADKGEGRTGEVDTSDSLRGKPKQDAALCRFKFRPLKALLFM